MKHFISFKGKMAGAAGWILIFAFIISPAFAEVTEQNIQDAVLEKGTATPEMDINKDGKIDVADLVKLIIPKDSRYIGTMSFDQKFALAPQSVDMVIGQTGSDATFNIENSPFFSDSFKMNGNFGTDTVAFSSDGTGTFENESDIKKRNPLNKNISWKLNIKDATVKDGLIQAKFTMTYTGFKQGSNALPVTGTLYLKGQVASEGLSFKDANNMTLLVQKYGVK